jgi:glutathionyl-hydroquinone reductase
MTLGMGVKFPTDDGGHFQRPPSQFRKGIEVGGEHPPALDRYHLYVSLACPWVCQRHSWTHRRIER